MRLLILGGAGQVGVELRQRAVLRGIGFHAPLRHELDLRDRAQIGQQVGAERWSAVINAAAYTDVDRAESEQDLAFDINAHGIAHVAACTGKLGIPLVHISTDYVFDGRKQAPYVERDEAAPLNVYGRSKLHGEMAVRLGNPLHVILRTSWVYSAHRRNFVKTILRLALERDRLDIVADQRSCPTAAGELAEACLDAALACATNAGATANGTYHFSGSGDASWHEFASEIVEIAAARTGRCPEVRPIKSCDYPTAAARPQDTRLDCSAATAAFGRAPVPWRQSVAETVHQLLENGRVQ
jgi:dTDP-4-dehydrorhamnose reductase